MNKARLIWTLGQIPVIKSILRSYANRFREGSIIKIISGNAAGFKWKRFHKYVNGYWTGQYELPIQEAICRELSSGDIFFDLGANAGFFSLVAAKKVGRNGKVLAFEPLPDNVDCIIEQFKLNNLDYCHVLREAISKQIGYAKFCYNKPGTSMAHLGEAKSGEKQIQVKINTLDQIIKTWGIPKLVKIDVEGAEVDVLKGAPELIKKATSVFLVELHGLEYAKGVYNIMSREGYEFFDINGIKVKIDNQLPHHVIIRKDLRKGTK